MTQLRVFTVKNLGGGKAGVECPHCHEKHVVRLSRWRKSLAGGTRPCPYCFKTCFMSEARREEFDRG